MYQWRKVGDVYVFEPRDDADSALNVRIKPMRTKEMTAWRLIWHLAYSVLPPPENLSINVSGPPQRSVQFAIRRGTLKGGLIEAAKQLYPSCWMVKRSGDRFLVYAQDYSKPATQP